MVVRHTCEIEISGTASASAASPGTLHLTRVKPYVNVPAVRHESARRARRHELAKRHRARLLLPRRQYSGPAPTPVPSLYLPCTFPVPSLYLPCTFPVPSLYSGPAPAPSREAHVEEREVTQPIGKSARRRHV